MIITRPPYQKPMLGTPINWAHPLAKGLIGCWIMNERGSNKIYDLSGRGNDGSFVNETFWTTGGINTDGANDSVSFSWSKLGITGYPFSIATAGKHHTLNANSGLVTFSTNNIATNSFMLGINTSNQATAITYGATLKAASSVKTLVAGEHYSIAGTYEGAAHRAVWLNGTGPVSETTSLAVNFSTIDRFNFGMLDRSADAWYLSKDVEYIYVYNRALTPSDIWQLYIEPYAMFEEMPVWMMYPQVVGNPWYYYNQLRRAD